VISIKASDIEALVGDGILQSEEEARRIWVALRARQLAARPREAREDDSTTTLEEAGGVGDVVRDLRRLVSFTNLLYCIAATMLTAVFSFLVFMFREKPLAQGLAALGYAALFVQWGLKLLAMGASAAGRSEGSELVGGALLIVPNLAAVVVGCSIVQLAGLVQPRAFADWGALTRDVHFGEVVRDPRLLLCSLIVEVCVLVCSGALYSLSSFPGQLIPLLGSAYLLLVSICLLASQFVRSWNCGSFALSVGIPALIPVWGSLAHTVVLFYMSQTASLPGDVRLGFMVSACNSGFWSLPCALFCTPKVFGSDASLTRLATSKDIVSVIRSEFWPSPIFFFSFAFYAWINIALLIFGLRIQSWVPVPYALIGVIATMLLTNCAPPRMRWFWRVFYNLPVSIVLFAVCSAYEHVTDTLWLGILSWLGSPQHFVILSIFCVRAVTLACAIWSLWYGLSRLFPQRMLRDLWDSLLPNPRLQEVTEAIARHEKSTSGAIGWARGLFSSTSSATSGGQQNAIAEELRGELARLQVEEGERHRRTERWQSWVQHLESSWLVNFAIVPLCWIGFTVLASVCDAPEPFVLLRYVLNISSVIYLVRAFGGLMLSSWDQTPHESEWGSPLRRLPQDATGPVLLVVGIRLIFLAQSSMLRNLAGLMFLASGFAALLRDRGVLLGTLLGSVISMGLIALGLLGDSKVLAFGGIISLYALGINGLYVTMGQNTGVLVCGITAVAVGTMHLGMSFEVYFLSMQNMTGAALPWSSYLTVFADNVAIETQLGSKLLRWAKGRILAL